MADLCGRAGVVEKPEPATAPSTLTIIGRYIIQPQVFAHLARGEAGSGGEIQLTDALEQLIRDGQAFHGLRFCGRRYDCGDKLGFLEATIALGLAHPELGTGTEANPELHISNRERLCHTVSIRRFCANMTSAVSSGDTLSTADAQAIGRAYALTLKAGGGRRVAVGYDGRLTSPELAAALVDGLVSEGTDVLRIGRGPTPMLYYAAATLGVDGGIMVTGSHNPPEYNGFKFVLRGRAFYGAAIQALAETALTLEAPKPRAAGLKIGTFATLMSNDWRAITMDRAR